MEGPQDNSWYHKISFRQQKREGRRGREKRTSPFNFEMTLAPLWTVASIAKLFWQISTLIRQLLEAGLASKKVKEGKRASPFNFETTLALLCILLFQFVSCSGRSVI